MRKPINATDSTVVVSEPPPRPGSIPKRSARLQSKGGRQTGTLDRIIDWDATANGQISDALVASMGRSGLATSGQLSGLSSLDIVAAVACAQSAPASATSGAGNGLNTKRGPVSVTDDAVQPGVKRAKVDAGKGVVLITQKEGKQLLLPGIAASPLPQQRPGSGCMGTSMPRSQSPAARPHLLIGSAQSGTGPPLLSASNYLGASPRTAAGPGVSPLVSTQAEASKHTEIPTVGLLPQASMKGHKSLVRAQSEPPQGSAEDKASTAAVARPVEKVNEVTAGPRIQATPQLTPAVQPETDSKQEIASPEAHVKDRSPSVAPTEFGEDDLADAAEALLSVALFCGSPNRVEATEAMHTDAVPNANQPDKVPAGGRPARNSVKRKVAAASGAATAAAAAGDIAATDVATTKSDRIAPRVPVKVAVGSKRPASADSVTTTQRQTKARATGGANAGLQGSGDDEDDDDNSDDDLSGGEGGEGVGGEALVRRTGRQATDTRHITMHLLEEGGYFDMPLKTAATALHVGMSVFKKVARSIGISRWPFRKRQSVREILEMIDKHLPKDVGIDLAAVQRVLLADMALQNGAPGRDLSPATKRFRQAVFKTTFKKNKVQGNSSRYVKQTSIPPQAAISLLRDVMGTRDMILQPIRRPSSAPAGPTTAAPSGVALAPTVLVTRGSNGKFMTPLSSGGPDFIPPTRSGGPSAALYPQGATAGTGDAFRLPPSLPLPSPTASMLPPVLSEGAASAGGIPGLGLAAGGPQDARLPFPSGQPYARAPMEILNWRPGMPVSPRGMLNPALLQHLQNLQGTQGGVTQQRPPAHVAYQAQQAQQQRPLPGALPQQRLPSAQVSGGFLRASAQLPPGATFSFPPPTGPAAIQHRPGSAPQPSSGSRMHSTLLEPAGLPGALARPQIPTLVQPRFASNPPKYVRPGAMHTGLGPQPVGSSEGRTQGLYPDKRVRSTQPHTEPSLSAAPTNSASSPSSGTLHLVASHMATLSGAHRGSTYLRSPMPSSLNRPAPAPPQPSLNSPAATTSTAPIYMQAALRPRTAPSRLQAGEGAPNMHFSDSRGGPRPPLATSIPRLPLGMFARSVGAPKGSMVQPATSMLRSHAPMTQTAPLLHRRADKGIPTSSGPQGETASIVGQFGAPTAASRAPAVAVTWTTPTGQLPPMMAPHATGDSAHSVGSSILATATAATPAAAAAAPQDFMGYSNQAPVTTSAGSAAPQVSVPYPALLATNERNTGGSLQTVGSEGKGIRMQRGDDDSRYEAHCMQLPRDAAQGIGGENISNKHRLLGPPTLGHYHSAAQCTVSPLYSSQCRSAEYEAVMGASVTGTIEGVPLKGGVNHHGTNTALSGGNPTSLARSPMCAAAAAAVAGLDDSLLTKHEKSVAGRQSPIAISVGYMAAPLQPQHVPGSAARQQ